MHKVTLTIGHKVGPVESLTTETVCVAVSETLGVAGYTAILCLGMWMGVPETSTRIEIIVDNERTANELCARVPALARALGQEAIMCESCPTTTTFVYQLDNELVSA